MEKGWFQRFFRGQDQPVLYLSLVDYSRQSLFSQDRLAAGTLEPGLSVISTVEKWFESSKMQFSKNKGKCKAKQAVGRRSGE